ncbi:MAG: aldo/keto reductase [Armatimonadota bacterium]|nr:aldo/keto reductase [Armatimonadota bacterium]
MEKVRFAEFELSRLMLGTAQLGLQYGIANKLGQPCYEEAKAIIAAAYESGVNCFDTAANYGDSEQVIGRALEELGIKDEAVVVSKVLPMADGLTASEADCIVEESVTESLRRLRMDSLPICMFHTDNNFLEYAESLLKLKDKGLVGHVGVSVNFPNVALKAVRSDSAEVIQLPTSVLDQRFIRLGIFDEGAKRGIGLFVRSIYLQGLLFVPENEVLPELTEVIPVRQRLQSLASQAGMSLAELAVRYLLGIEGITCLVVGAESVEQVIDNARLVSQDPLDSDLAAAVSNAVPDLPETILFPRRWSKRIPDAKPVGR